MASELRVNTLKDAAGNNSIGVSSVSGALPRIWLTMANDASVATNGSFGVASTVDSSTGRYTVNFSNNFSGAGAYSVAMIAIDADGNGYIGGNTNTSTCEFRNYSGGFVDAPTQGIICGDLA